MTNHTQITAATSKCTYTGVVSHVICDGAYFVGFTAADGTRYRVRQVNGLHGAKPGDSLTVRAAVSASHGDVFLRNHSGIVTLCKPTAAGLVSLAQ